MKVAFIDLEANGLLNHKDLKIHCMAIAIGKEEPKLYIGHDQIVPVLKSLIEDPTVMVVGHNYIAYDNLATDLVLGLRFPLNRIIDTQLYSEMLGPRERAKCSPKSFAGKPVGVHSLANWGYFLSEKGYNIEFKIEHEDWTEYSDQMGERCKGDVKLTREMIKFFLPFKGFYKSPAYKTEIYFRESLALQAYRGCPFDLPKAKDLLDHLHNRKEELRLKLLEGLPLNLNRHERKDPKTGENVPIVRKVKTKAGEYTVNFRKYFDSLPPPVTTIDTYVGDFCSFTLEEPNLDSPNQRKELLLSMGWVPDDWNYKKDSNGKLYKDPETREPVKLSPKVTETSLASLEGGGEISSCLAEYLKINGRINLLKSLVLNSESRGDSRVESGGLSCGARSHRVTHRTVVNIPSANPSVYVGRQFRELFIPSKGKIMVGTDFSNLENFLIANSTAKYDGGAYARLLLEGDSHQRTADLLTEIKGEEVSRSMGKTVNYAIAFGCSASKLVSLLGFSHKQAEKFLRTFWEHNVGLADLKNALLRQWKTKGFITGIDDRHLYPQSAHSVLNTYIQAAGSVCTKRTSVRTESMLSKVAGLEYVQLLHVHDEFDGEMVDGEENREIYLKALKKNIDRLNYEFNLSYPLSTDTKFGLNWAEIH